MASLAELNLPSRANQARLRALLNDVVQERIGVRAESRLALAVWFRKGSEPVQNLLELSTAELGDAFADPVQFSLGWKGGSNGPPHVRIYATSIRNFSRLLASDRQGLSQFFERYEVLFSDKTVLTREIMDEFKIVTAPSGLLEGWYIDRDHCDTAGNLATLVATYGRFNKQIGIVRTWESPDFQSCKGILHVEVDQRWVPLSPVGLTVHTFYNDWLHENSGYFLFEGGSVYRVSEFEIKTNSEYSSLVLEKARDDKYVEVSLRSVRPTPESAA